MKKLEQEYKYYLKNKSNLIRKYNGQYVVIKDSDVIGAYFSQEEAYEETAKTEEVGTFLIQHCTQADSAPAVYHARVVF